MEQLRIYIGTVLLEAQRWNSKAPLTCRVSEWIERFSRAGFDGIELWQNHAALATEEELTALRQSRVPIPIFNSYASMDDAGLAGRQLATRFIREFGAKAVKFNVGKNPDTVEKELTTAAAWSAEMQGVRLLCECHGGTALQEPCEAARLLANRPEIDVIVHAFSSTNLDDWMTRLNRRIVHVHSVCMDEKGNRVRLRTRAGFVRERLRQLRDSGFQGTFTIEFTEGVAKAPENPDALFAAACDDMAFLREGWES